MDVIQDYINLYYTGFEIGVALAAIPVIMGSAIGFVYKIAMKG